MSSDVKDLLGPFLRAQSRFWRRYSFAVVVLFVATFSRNTSVQAPLFSIELVPMLEITAVAVVVAALAYRRRRFSEERLSEIRPEDVDLSSLAKGPKRRTLDADRLSRLKALEATDRKLALLALESGRAATVTAWLANTLVMLGFAIAWNVSDALTMMPYVIAALALTYSGCPRLKALAARAEQWGRAVPAAAATDPPSLS